MPLNEISVQQHLKQNPKIYICRFRKMVGPLCRVCLIFRAEFST